MAAILTFYIPVVLCLLFTCEVLGLLKPEIVYTWDEFNFHWPLETMDKTEEHMKVKSVIERVTTYKHYTFATLNPTKKEVPFTLTMINVSSKMPELKPYPNFDYYTKKNCDDLLFVSSIAIDTETGFMWIVDTSAQDSTSGKCSPKIVIYDIDGNKEVHRHVFPTIVIGQRSVYLNDIILDHKGNDTFAYITDALDYKLIAYNRKLDKSYYFTHPSMDPEPETVNNNVTVCNSTATVIKFGISSVTISSDNEFIYYCTAGGLTVYQIQTSVLRNQFSNSITFASAVHEAGNKLLRGTGLTYGRDNQLYYFSFEGGKIIKWSVDTDAKKQGGFSMVTMETQSIIVTSPTVKWIQSLWLDNDDNLWFISDNFKCSDANSNKSQPNYFVWRTSLNEVKYSVLNRKRNSNNGGFHTSASDLFILIIVNYSFGYIFNSLLTKL